MGQYLQRLEIESVEEVGEDTVLPQYQQIVHVVEVYDQNGDPWEPAPGPDPWDDLSVLTRTTTTGTTNIGDTLTGTLAVYVGGVEPIVEEYQWQESETGNSNWSGVTNWTEITGANPTETTLVLQVAQSGKYVRFASKATDGTGEVARASGNHVGPIQQYELGTVSPVPQAAQGSNGTTLTFTSSITGGDYPANGLSYLWDIRSGQASFNGSRSGPSCSITVDGAYPGSINLRLTVEAPYGLNSPQSPIALISITE